MAETNATRKPSTNAGLRRRWAVDRRQLLILLVAAVMLASFGLFVLWPKHEELTRLGMAVGNERCLLTQRVSASHEGVLVSARIPSLRKARDSIERRLPGEPNVAEFLRMLDVCVARTPTVTQEVARSAVPYTGGTPAIGLCLMLKGPFLDVYRAVAGIEGIERLSRFRRLRVSQADAGGNVVAEAEILIYYLPDQSEATNQTLAQTQGETRT
ncbi:MAG: hypothetical protein ISS74_00750 [Planctomycetes bacterium]|nr:hypothetical protein [Planctomycetota bacterium]